MKKPVKLTSAQLQEVIAKRKHKLITVEKPMTRGNLDKVGEQVSAFATSQGVGMYDVIIANGWRSACLKVRRYETDEEKAVRVRREEDAKYRNKKWDYDRYLEQQRRAAAEAQSLITRNRLVVTCNCKCTCCK